MRVFRTVGIVTVLFVVMTLGPSARTGWLDGPQGRPKPQDKQPDKDKQADKTRKPEGDKQAKPRDEQHGKSPAARRGEQPAQAGPERGRSSGERGQAPRAGERDRAQQPRDERGRGPGESQRAIPRPPDRYPRDVRTERQAREWQDRRGWQRADTWQPHDTWRQHRAVRWDHEHRTWLQRGGYGGFYIPADRFYVHFGPGHYFRLHTRPIIVLGYPRFQYGGYWFMLVDPWPEAWAYDWYAADDLFIDYDDGYYLYNRRHPGVAIAISVVF